MFKCTNEDLPKNLKNSRRKTKLTFLCKAARSSADIAIYFIEGHIISQFDEIGTQNYERIKKFHRQIFFYKKVHSTTSEYAFEVKSLAQKDCIKIENYLEFFLGKRAANLFFIFLHLQNWKGALDLASFPIFTNKPSSRLVISHYFLSLEWVLYFIFILCLTTIRNPHFLVVFGLWVFNSGAGILLTTW